MRIGVYIKRNLFIPKNTLQGFVVTRKNPFELIKLFFGAIKTFEPNIKFLFLYKKNKLEYILNFNSRIMVLNH